MFCLMDVSGSMDESRKDLAKRFFILLYLFLSRHYEQTDVVFIRHHTQAQEVDEDEFFHATETGGTVVSSALTLMHEIIRARYMGSEWNIYGAQASDGDNWQQDFVQVPRAAGQQASCRCAATSPTCRWPTKTRTCGRSTRACATPIAQLRDAEDRDAGADLPGVPRPVQERDGGRMIEAADILDSRRRRRRRQAAARLPAPGLDLRADRALLRRDPRDGRALRARHLPVAAGADLRRADAGRLRVGRHAGELPPLVATASSSSRARRTTAAATWAWPTRS